MSALAPFIVVTNNIAAGKSTLVERLAMRLRVQAYPERVEDNPFFGDPAQHPLESEAWFLADSAVAHRAIERAGSGGVQERSVYEHVPVFARARSRFGWLSESQLELLQTLARLLVKGLPAPDLLIYSQADVELIRERIATRGRRAEQAIDPSYLSTLSELYDEFVDDWRLSPVYRLDTARVDVREDEGFQIACEGIEATLS
jgi:deoxyadenosine/deoxycytidine kinase